MSRRKEFGEGHQLKMFMSPDEIIESVHKADSRLSGNQWTPRAQWEHPESGLDYENSAIDTSLRDEKLGRLDRNYYAGQAFDRPWDTAPPVEIWHAPAPKRGNEFAEGMTLVEGHHRLAHAEREKIPYLAVTHGWKGA